MMIVKLDFSLSTGAFDYCPPEAISQCLFSYNLVPRVLWLFGQRMGASSDSGVLEFSYRKISAVKQWKSLQGSQSKNLNFFEFPRVSTGAHPLTKNPEDSGYEIGLVQE